MLFQNSKPAALFTIAICAMWPTVLNTAMGVRAIPQDYLNVARVLRLSPAKRFFKVLVPATLPYMFTGFRLSLGIAWLVIVAAEMLTGSPGVGGFLWQEYNSLIYEHIILCILTIGLVGFALDRVMSADRNAPARRLARSSHMACLELQNVSKSYRTGGRTVDVLSHVNLQVSEGEFVAIVGYSGAGKTTLISLLAGLAAPDSGRALFEGRPMSGPGPERGVVFQNYSLLPWLSAYDNVRLAVDEVHSGWTAERRRAAHRGVPRDGEPAERRAIASRRSSRAACGSGSRWPARCRSIPRCCCSTSRSRRSTR